MKKILFAIVIAILSVSCEDNNLERSKPVVSEVCNVMEASVLNGYGSLEELTYVHRRYAERYGVEHYRVMRVLTYAELLAGALDMTTAMSWGESMSLSKYPRVIYSLDGVPKYYEFILYKYEKPAYAIVSSALNDVSSVIFYVSEINDDFYDITEIGRYFYQCVGDGFPNEKLFRERDSGNFWRYCNGEMIPVREELSYLSDVDQLSLMIEQMNEEDMRMMEYNRGMIEKVVEEERCLARDYWEMINDVFINTFVDNEFLYEDNDKNDLRDKKIAEIIEQNMSGDYEKIHEISSYKSPHLRVTHWSGYCGPSALAFVYRGLFETYPIVDGEYINVYGDGSSGAFEEHSTYAEWNFDIETRNCSSFDLAKQKYISYSYDSDNGLSACFYRHCSWIGKDKNGDWHMPLYDFGLNKGIQAATDGMYKSEFTIVPIKCIEKDNPVIIAVNCNHYLVAIASAKPKKGKYELVVDNGSTTGSRNYAPYWHKFNGWNLHYVIKLK